MSGTGIAETATAIISLLSEIRSLEASGRAGNREHLRIVEALRNIYFTPEGTIHLLERLSNGESLSRDEIENTLPEFNDAEWRVLRELEYLEGDRLFRSRFVALRDSRVLREIAYGKRDLRRNLQELLNDSLTNDLPINEEEVFLALKSVRALNASIELIEAMYNPRTPN